MHTGPSEVRTDQTRISCSTTVGRLQFIAGVRQAYDSLSDRRAPYPRGVTYPVFELARDNIIAVEDYPELAAVQPMT